MGAEGELWPPAAATGVGSLPGTDAREATRIVLGELPDLPHLVELPARGPGADLVGRTAALLSSVARDLAVETTATGWRFADAPGRVTRRARSWLGEDLDALEEEAAGRRGALKSQLCGPWTLAAALELRTGERAVSDPGAVRDLAQALAAVAADHVADLRRRVPGADVVLQLDEPSLPAVLRGGVPTQSGLSRYRAVDRPDAQARLRDVLEAVAAAGAAPAVHCCAADVPVDLVVGAGARALSVDLALVAGRDDEAWGRAVEDGVRLLLGIVPTTPVSLSDLAATVGPVERWWHRLGFAPETLAARVAVSPACGLAGASPEWVRTAYARCVAAGRALRDDRVDTGEGTAEERDGRG